jgi:uncharacterized Zn finger protein (UPF0148 family)
MTGGKVSSRQPFGEVHQVMIALANGETIEPHCPWCGRPNLVFSFTQVKSKYGLFIFCPTCQQHAHLRFLSRPVGFDEKYVLKEYQEQEERVIHRVEELLEEEQPADQG